MKLLIFIIAIKLLLVSTKRITVNQDLNKEWASFKSTFGKIYEGLNDLSRRLIWEENLKYIQEHNIKFDLGQISFSLGINEFADMTQDEFKLMYLSSNFIKQKPEVEYQPPLSIKELPETVDWTKKGYVTNVKDQGNCGSCWAFSSTGAMEGQYFRKYKVLGNFSEQQLVDCNTANFGCQGGWMNIAFNYIRTYGIESEESYPYTAKKGRCLYNKSKIITKCYKPVNIKTDNETDLADAVANVGPIAVAIDASQRSFRFYKYGVYNEPGCSPDIQDHAVLAVGYGIENGDKYWLVKNSWGKSWGLKGYIKMAKDKNNQCGIATTASYPVV